MRKKKEVKRLKVRRKKKKKRGYLVRVFKPSFCFVIHKIVCSTLEFIVWLIFCKYSFQKTVFYFPD